MGVFDAGFQPRLHVGVHKEELRAGAAVDTTSAMNKFPSEEAHGISVVFYKDEKAESFTQYSA